MSATQLAVDLAARSYGSALNDTKVMMARHPRKEHGWGIRRINRELKMTDKQVKEACGEA